MGTKKLMTAYYELIAATPNAEAQITSAVVPAAAKAGDSGGSALGGNLAASLKKFAGPVAAALSVAGVSKFVKDSVGQFSSLTGSVASLQRVTGGTTSQVSALQGAMRLSGMDAGAATGSLTIFAKKLQGVQGDSEKTAAMQKLLGTSITDSTGKLKPMNELLPQVADKFKSMPDGVEKTALATQLFGRSGTAMLPFLNKGSAGIGQLEAKAKSLGIVLDDGAKNKWAAYRNAQREVQMSGEGLKVTVGEALVPAFTGFANFITSSVTPTLQRLITWLKTPAVQAFANNLGSALASVGGTVGNLVSGMLQKLGGLTNWAQQNKAWLQPIAAGIAAATAAFKAYKTMQTAVTGVTKAWSSATKIATTVQALFNTTMKANALGIAIAAIAAITAALVYFFTKTKTGRALWAQFTQFLSTTIHSIEAFFLHAAESIYAKWHSVTDFFGMISGMIGGFFGGIGEILSIGWRVAGEAVLSKWHGIVDFFGNIPGSIGGFFHGLADTISAPFRDAFRAIKSWWNGTIGGKGFDVPDWIPGVGGRSFRIPMLATGGMIAAAGTVMVGERGPELLTLPQGAQVTPLSKAGSGRPINVTFEIYGSDANSVANEAMRRLATVIGG
ncbi:phage tail tape measure protein [Bifidobacterium sp. ESL0790]|uniref:phage tail tape measure protein n=1 Tax=Bifidobacterium sp. ESL0790 TaxID=2983233 RepID=UPI0023F62AF3|nr:phage tail tape measure protein [Bifidobacterium sp. ESL0790]WEV72154.1 phage tail tape measure protein [Bifidobacterium sp. ESL0790]